MLTDESKLPYVLMSRADKERSIYMNKICQIKENLLGELPLLKKASELEIKQSVLGISGAQLIFNKIDEVIKKSVVA